MIEIIPQEMKDRPNWICYQLEDPVNGSKPRKIPKNPKSGRNLTGEVAKWGTDFDAATQAVEKFELSGLGFVFKSGDGICGIDIDNCVVDGNINEFANAMIKRCDSYTEFSPSRTGVHIIVKTDNKGKILLKRKQIEVYSEGRFFTVSGFSINPNRKLNKVDLEKIVQQYDNPDSTQEIVNKIFNSIDDNKFSKLWNGEWKSNYETWSEADLALCGVITKWTTDPAQIDSIFRMSKMMRPKWDRSAGKGKTYGAITIEKALSKTPPPGVLGSCIVEMDQFLTMQMPQVETIMFPWLTFGSTHMIYAARGSGKTFFTLSISMAISHSTDFGFWSVEKPVDVLYVDGEMLPQIMKQRVESLKCNLHQKTNKWSILSSGLNLQSGGSAINISKPHWQDFIYESVIENNTKLVVLDNISALTPGVEENESTQWDHIALWLNRVKHTGCAVIIVHHSGKKGIQRGTSSREDALDSVIHLKSLSVDPTVGIDVDVIFEKSRHITGQAVSSFNFRLTGDPSSTNLLWSIGDVGVSKRNAVIELLSQGKSYGEISAMVGVSKSMISKYKKYAIDNGWIEIKSSVVSVTQAGKSHITQPHTSF